MQNSVELRAERAELERALDVFFDGTTEVRILNTQYNETMSGVFDDPAKLVAEVLSDPIQNQNRNIYWTAHKLNPRPASNAIYPRVKDTTKGPEIAEYRWLPIDVDPSRAPGFKKSAATFIEQEAARGVAEEVEKFFIDLGFPPVFVSSGNGFYVLPPVSIQNEDGADALVWDVLMALKRIFSTLPGPLNLPTASIDESLADPAQILKIPGTISRKGKSTGERPHRLAQMLRVPTITKRMDRAFLIELRGVLIAKLPDCVNWKFGRESVGELLPADAEYFETVLYETRLFCQQFGIRYFEKSHGEDVLFVMSCPGEHNSGNHPTEAALIIHGDGSKAFDCKHPSCTVHSFAGDTVPIQKFMESVDPRSEFKWSLPPVDQTLEYYQGQGVKHAIEKAAAAVTPAIKSEWKYEQVDGSSFDYVCTPLLGITNQPQKGYEGWFARGSIHLIGGASGAGKSKFMLPFLQTQSKGEMAFRHRTFRLPYLVLLADRDEGALARFLKDEDPGTKDNCAPLEDGAGARGVLTAIEKRREKTGVMPAIVFIEGIDFIAGKNNDSDAVSSLMGALTKIARRYHIAMIGSLGSAKMKKKDEWSAKRSALIGASTWGRRAETIMVMEGDDGPRTLTVLSRNGKPEKLGFVFNDSSQLVETEIVKEEPDMLEAFARRRAVEAEGDARYFTVADFMEFSGLSRAGAFKAVKRGHEDGILKTKRGPKQSAGAYTWACSLTPVGKL